MQAFCRWLAKKLGWTLVDNIPDEKCYVVIGYPHTSNWDFMLAMLFKFAVGFQFNWIAKHTLFFWPLGILMRALGGIGVDRARTKGFIGELARAFQEHERMVLVITPEGTRGHTDCWRSGFYHLALSAEVPVVLGFVCFTTKRIGLGPMIHLTGDEETDLAKIREFYADKIGLYPELEGEICFRSRPQPSNQAETKSD
ncbi:1-acyl-sn-glycerol-3-phosphate acyltransferase [Motiliproteus sp.]|uniref:1-acyl-sn-glycerol-3-phosphate acyltransferase n=1 Tax=Motiliproteus sp. TaxID=1898955 RepID=UPI003BAB4F81